MTVIRRNIVSTPRRAATKTWLAVCDLVAPDPGPAREELDAVTGIAAMLIAEECTKDAPIIFSGAGSQLRIYTLHGEEAIEADPTFEAPLAFPPAVGDWSASLPASGDDLDVVAQALALVSQRITARNADATKTTTVEDTQAPSTTSASRTDHED